jgi:surface protein
MQHHSIKTYPRGIQHVSYGWIVSLRMPHPLIKIFHCGIRQNNMCLPCFIVPRLSIRTFLYGMYQVCRSWMGSMFENATSFHQNISHWDTSRVLCMECMFHKVPQCSIKISRNGMFCKVTSFNQNIL